MRSKSTSVRGWFGLIRKGSGAVVGVAKLAGVGDPLSADELISHFDKHRIPPDVIKSGEVAKWNVPWRLAEVHAFETPIPYRHKSGAVTWVSFDYEVMCAISEQVDATAKDRLGPKLIVSSASAATPWPSEAQVAKPLKIPAPSSGAVVGRTELTEGNLKNSHFYLRGLLDRFPTDVIGGPSAKSLAARTLLVEWGGGKPEETDIDGSKQFFRKRGWIRRFFEMTGAEAGDRVEVQETGPYAYRVQLLRKSGAL